MCRACRLAPPAFTRAVSYGLYDGRLQPAARALGHMLAQAIAKLGGEAPDDMLVVPVPLHRSRMAQRGFNQARALARHAHDALAITHPLWRLELAAGTLLRQRATESQAGLSPRQRRENLRGAFTVTDPQAVDGKHILLVDDIMTTGATVRSAALALRRAGAASVRVATLARAHRASRAGETFIERDNDSGLPGGFPGVQAPTTSMFSSAHQPSF